VKFVGNVVPVFYYELYPTSSESSSDLHLLDYKRPRVRT